MGSVQTAIWVVAMLVLLAIAFDFMNGFHDAANSIATVVSTGVLKPQQAVMFAAFFNALAICVFQLKVAATVGKTAASDAVPPTWVIVSCYLAIGLGTLFVGWRIVKTMGQRITKLKPVGGFCAETGGAVPLFLATALGIPVSTTRTITGAIVGVGSVRRASAVRWGVAGNIVWAWVFTILASAFVAGVAYWLSLVLFA